MSNEHSEITMQLVDNSGIVLNDLKIKDFDMFSGKIFAHAGTLLHNLLFQNEIDAHTAKLLKESGV